MQKLSCFMGIAALLIQFSLHAEITVDGSLGAEAALAGPDYAITADLGLQRGANLFHSFGIFELDADESAVFSGPDSVGHVIGRVTGGSPSRINGRLRSEIAGADVYLLNPAGILFGENAELDIQGGFHAAAANVLHFQDGGEFNADPSQVSSLSITAPAAFGFLEGAVELQNSNLSAPTSLSLAGGSLRIQNSRLRVPGGQVNLSTDAQAEKGDLAVSDNSLIDVSGPGAGAVNIRGRRLQMRDSSILADTQGELDGKGIDLELSESIEISGNVLALSNSTFANGGAGRIRIAAPRVEINAAVADASSFAQGRAGDIEVDATQLTLKQGAAISSDSFVSGQSGHVNIKAAESISVSGERDGALVVPGRIEKNKNQSQITTDTYQLGLPGQVSIRTAHMDLAGGLVATNSFGMMPSGNIDIEAERLDLTKGALISNTAFFDGGGGEMRISAGTVTISGRRPGLLIIASGTFENNQSGLVSFTFGGRPAGRIVVSADNMILEDEGSISAATFSAGKAGDVTVEVNTLRMSNGGQINNSNGGLLAEEFLVGLGDGGAIDIKAKDEILMEGVNERGLPSGVFSNTLSPGRGGNINIMAGGKLTLTDGGTVSANSLHVGDAGRLSVEAEKINLTNGGQISTSAQNAVGGDIIVKTPALLYLHSGQIITSVGGGTGDGGNIRIETPRFTVLNNAGIAADAHGGNGGNITIDSERFLSSNGSRVSASSELGIDGEIVISSPEQDVSGELVILPAALLGPEAVLDSACGDKTRIVEQTSRFTANHYAGSPPSPRDLQPGFFIFRLRNQPELSRQRL
ncbi:MAG: filamentous hemagglutinin N-terminal domain-containing protein [Gammaproteobacteria bacterium]|nr:filamentous hemagglutinin N-terminal domain-containing protein [Gammaproteobacteria bacterium]